uniref:Uncharacterized protein n=1 Tax=Aegilops tauschii subsp. strangulata TaxID=200361 RepID=A0A453AP26_AEGTS
LTSGAALRPRPRYINGSSAALRTHPSHTRSAQTVRSRAALAPVPVYFQCASASLLLLSLPPSLHPAITQLRSTLGHRPNPPPRTTHYTERVDPNPPPTKLQPHHRQVFGRDEGSTSEIRRPPSGLRPRGHVRRSASEGKIGKGKVIGLRGGD